MVAILDYGIGNVSSIKNMLKKIGAEAEITSDHDVISRADKLILPGVGHFDYCMQQLRAASFWDLMHELVMDEKVPILGVCVGCQMLMDSSEEGVEPGLGWIKGRVVRFDQGRMPADHKVPHMAWTDVAPAPGSPLYDGMASPRFYFVHSYHVLPEDESLVTGRAMYGYSFTASLGAGNINGVQFHPEKSHRYGIQLYSNYVNAGKS